MSSFIREATLHKLLINDSNARNQNEIQGGTSIEEAANIFHSIISGNGTEAQNNVVCANAGMAIANVKNLSPFEGFQLAKESLLSKKGLNALQKLQTLSNTL